MTKDQQQQIKAKECDSLLWDIPEAARWQMRHRAYEFIGREGETDGKAQKTGYEA